MRSLTGTSWGSSKETLLQLYRQYIRPSLEYAAPIWFPNAPPTSIGLIQRVQNQALRIATGYLKSTSEDHLHQEAKVLSIANHLELHSTQFLASTIRSSHPSHSIATAFDGPRQIRETLILSTKRYYRPCNLQSNRGGFSVGKVDTIAAETSRRRCRHGRQF